MRKKRRWNRNNIILTIIGALLTISVVAGLAVNFTGSNDPDPVDLDNPADFEITQAPNQVSFPAPDPSVAIDRMLAHSTGLFEVPVLDGDWGVFGDQNLYEPNQGRADIIMSSREKLAIAQAYMLVGVNYEDTQSLSDQLLTDSYFTNEWSSDYESVTIADRTVGSTFLTIDFRLEDEDLTYLGRQVSWLDGGNLYNLRFVVPSNNPDLLANLQKTYIEHFVFYPNMLDTSLIGWQTYTDHDLDLMLKVPDDWRQIAGGNGRTTTYGSSSDPSLQVTIQHIDDEIDFEDFEAVTDWVVGFREGANVQEGQAVEQKFGNGYWFTYTYPNTDGDTVSSALVFFPAYEGGIALAEIRKSGADTNLLDSETNPLARQIVETVTLLAPNDYVYLEQ